MESLNDNHTSSKKIQKEPLQMITKHPPTRHTRHPMNFNEYSNEYQTIQPVATHHPVWHGMTCFNSPFRVSRLHQEEHVTASVVCGKDGRWTIVELSLNYPNSVVRSWWCSWMLIGGYWLEIQQQTSVHTHVRTMVLEYLPLFTNVYPINHPVL